MLEWGSGEEGDRIGEWQRLRGVRSLGTASLSCARPLKHAVTSLKLATPALVLVCNWLLF